MLPSVVAQGPNYFNSLLEFLEDAIDAFPDRRTGNNTTCEIRDAALPASLVFFTSAFTRYPVTTRSAHCWIR